MINTNTESLSEYLHGTHPDEQARLSLLNDLLNQSPFAAAAIRRVAILNAMNRQDRMCDPGDLFLTEPK